MDDVTNELVEPVEDFLDKWFTPDRRLAMLEDAGNEPKLWAEVAELGWFELTVPENAGGLGMNPSQLGPVFRAFGERLLAGPMLEQMLVPGLVFAADSDSGVEHATFTERLRSALTGDVRIVIADPGVTYDWLHANGALHVTNNRLNGVLELIRFGAEADEILVVAQDEIGPLVVLVDAGRNGLAVSARPSADPGAAFASIRCDDVVIESSDIVARGAEAALLGVSDGLCKRRILTKGSS